MKKWEKAFRDYAERLCRHPLVLEAYLVGSRARGDNLPYSDYDVVVVVPPVVDKLDAAYQLRRLRREPFPLDLIPLYPEELRDPIYAEMLRHAKPLCREGDERPTLLDESVMGRVSQRVEHGGRARPGQARVR